MKKIVLALAILGTSSLFPSSFEKPILQPKAVWHPRNRTGFTNFAEEYYVRFICMTAPAEPTKETDATDAEDVINQAFPYLDSANRPTRVTSFVSPNRYAHARRVCYSAKCPAYALLIFGPWN